MQTELILYALIAAGLVFWLKSILGTRHGDERERPNPFTNTQMATDKNTDQMLDDNMGAIMMADEKALLPKNVTISNNMVELALEDIAAIEQEFNVGKFASAAQDAFAIVVEAFGAGDRDTLKNLTEPQVYAAFEKALLQREAAGETMSTEIHTIRHAEILDAKTDTKKAYITLRFVADETCVIKNKEGAIIFGDPDKTTQMNDIWVFSKPLKSRDPRWFVSETRDGDVIEETRTPLPDAL